MALQRDLMHAYCNIHYEYNYLYAALILGQLQYPLTRDPCGVYSRVVTLRSAPFIRGNTVCVQ